jgi:hypothetical protein
MPSSVLALARAVGIVVLTSGLACSAGSAAQYATAGASLTVGDDGDDDGASDDDPDADDGSGTAIDGDDDDTGASEDTDGGPGGPVTMLLPATASTAACHQGEGGETVEKAVDGDPSTKFRAGGSSVWLRIDTSGPYLLSHYAITSADDAPENDPVRWLLLGSDDGHEWTELDARTHEAFSDRLERHEYTVGATEHHRFYLLRMENAAGGTVQIADLELHGRSALDDESVDPPLTAHGLTATAVSRSQIDLEWQAASDDAVFRVEQSSDGQVFAPIGYASRGAKSFSVRRLQPGTTAHFRIVAENGSGAAPHSNVVSTTTPPVIGFATADGWLFAEGGYSLLVPYGIPVLPQAAFDRLIDEHFTTYPAMAAVYHPTAVKDLKLTFDPAYDGVAYASGTDIVISSTYAAAHPDDLDVIVHEGFHLVQAYAGDVPGWATEGLADYARWSFGRLNADACWTMQRYEPGQHYTDAYGVTARFFLWLDTERAPGIAERLDERLRAGAYDDAFWTTEAGASIDELWAAYSDLPEHAPVSYD